jgi:coenzyme F420-reducing hydrogenase beta subunit
MTLSPQAMIDSRLCTGCGACVSFRGPADARIGWNANGQLQPMGDPDWLARPSASFARLCPFSPTAANEDAIAADRFPAAPHSDPAIGRHHAAYVGHASEGDWRAQGSSGGMVSWVAAELLRRGLIDGVAHVGPVEPGENGFFAYRISRDEAALRAGAQSRYHPVTLAAVLDEMRATPGRYAVIGIPCFIKAVHLARSQDPWLRRHIVYTLGLVCGHMKSRHMVESFAWQMGLPGAEPVQAVDYRVKNPDRPANWYRARLTLRDGGDRQQDWWHLIDGDWGSGFFQNPACDWCDDVVAETADISFGDAWVEPYASDGRGANVVVVRDPALHALIEDARATGRLALDPVDAAFVRDTQAAGFRQRREGLAYRLTWRRRGVRPVKRVAPSRGALPLRRRLVYRTRHLIARASPLLFRLARAFRAPALFLRPARALLTLYSALTYSRGRLGRLFDRIEARYRRDAA